MKTSCLVLVLLGAVHAAEPEVTVKQVSFKQLKEAVAAHKGKVVVIDMWGTFCVPCKEEFHNLVEIHKQHEKAGVVCMSVALDPSTSKDALAFLKSKKAAFQNFLLDEDNTKDLCENFQFGAVPAVFVFDKQGKRHDFTLEDPRKQFTYKDVKAFVARLVAKP